MPKDPNIPKFPQGTPYSYSYGYNSAFIDMLKENLLTEDALKRVLDSRGVVEESRGLKFSWLRAIGFSTVMYLSWKITSNMYELFMKKDDEKPSTAIEAEEKKEEKPNEQ